MVRHPTLGHGDRGFFWSNKKSRRGPEFCHQPSTVKEALRTQKPLRHPHMAITASGSRSDTVSRGAEGRRKVGNGPLPSGGGRQRFGRRGRSSPHRLPPNCLPVDSPQRANSRLQTTTALVLEVGEISIACSVYKQSRSCPERSLGVDGVIHHLAPKPAATFPMSRCSTPAPN